MRHSGEEITNWGARPENERGTSTASFPPPLPWRTYLSGQHWTLRNNAISDSSRNEWKSKWLDTDSENRGNLLHHSTLYNGGIKTIMYQKGQWSLRKSFCSASKSSYQYRFCEVLLKTLVYVRRPSGMKTAVSMQTTSVLIQSTDTQHQVVSSVGMKLKLWIHHRVCHSLILQIVC